MIPAEVEARTKRAAERAVEGSVVFARHHPIIETFQGEVIWEGVVTEFVSLGGKHVYAWAVEGEKEPQFIAVLDQHPIHSPLAAVRAWIVSQGRK